MPTAGFVRIYKGNTRESYGKGHGTGVYRDVGIREVPKIQDPVFGVPLNARDPSLLGLIFLPPLRTHICVPA